MGLAQRFCLRCENTRVVMSHDIHDISSAQLIMTKSISGIERRILTERSDSPLLGCRVSSPQKHNDCIFSCGPRPVNVGNKGFPRCTVELRGATNGNNQVDARTSARGFTRHVIGISRMHASGAIPESLAYAPP